MRITGRTHITPRGGVDKARLNSAQHQSWMEAGDQYEPIRTTHAAAFRKEPRQVADVIEHETCENAMKRAIRKWQSLCQIVRDEPNAIPARLATRLGHHPLAEVHRRAGLARPSGIRSKLGAGLVMARRGLRAIK